MAAGPGRIPPPLLPSLVRQVEFVAWPEDDPMAATVGVEAADGGGDGEDVKHGGRLGAGTGEVGSGRRHGFVVVYRTMASKEKRRRGGLCDLRRRADDGKSKPAQCDCPQPTSRIAPDRRESALARLRLVGARRRLQ